MFLPAKKSSTLILPDLPDVDYYPNFLNKEDSDCLLNTLTNNINFEPETYIFNNETIITKRKISYHSEIAYTYSTQTYAGKPWTPELLFLKESIEKLVNHHFNAVLVNLYDNGEAGIGWHSDKEKELGKEPIIASISLGQSRRFAFRHRKELVGLKNPPRLVEYMLNSGDLLIMKGNTQDIFEHSVIKDKSATGLRINLTFRFVYE